MRHLAWQKSSFSGSGGNGACVELAATTAAVWLRESDVPAITLTASPAATRALLSRIKTGGLHLRDHAPRQR
ncbi:DUF397 domain-containing protein [Streptomyces xiamenensis]